MRERNGEAGRNMKKRRRSGEGEDKKKQMKTRKGNNRGTNRQKGVERSDSCHSYSCKFDLDQYSSGSFLNCGFLSLGSKVFPFKAKQFAFDPREGVLTCCPPHLVRSRLDGEWLDEPQVPLLQGVLLKLGPESDTRGCYNVRSHGTFCDGKRQCSGRLTSWL